MSGTVVWTPLVAATLAAGLMPGIEVRGEGFRDPTSSAFELGRAGGRIAQGDDASSVAANPANLADLSAPEVEISPEAVYFRVQYQPLQGPEVTSSDPWKFLPDVYGALPIPHTPLTFGFGVTAPFGLSNEWPQNNPTTAVGFPYYASLMVINANPSLAWKINDRLKLGVGLDIFDSQLDLRITYPVGAPQYFGSGTGFGGNAGVTWEPFDGHRFAVTYRSPVGVDYSGTMSGLPPGNSPFTSAITFPTIVSTGYGVQVTKTIRLETDVEWIQFSRFGSLPLSAGSTPLQYGLPASIAENWRDTFTFGLAGDWKFAPKWVLRGGYQFYQTPVPSSTLSPAIPDANQNAITVGIGYKAKHHGLELAYAAILYNERDITTGPFAGKYQVSAHLISLSYRYSF